MWRRIQRNSNTSNDLFNTKLFAIPDSYQYEYDSNRDSNNNLHSLKDLPFYCWDTTKFGFDFCCLNHALGLPRKENKEMPLFPYEKTIVDILYKEKHLWVLKATGLGITELILRYMVWLCVKDDKLKGSQMIVITGPRIDLAITLIQRMKALFYELGIRFQNKETTLELNGVHIAAYPSNHLDSARGLKNPSFILLDESDFFQPHEQQNARDISERYIAKSNPYIVLISTPNAPGLLFDKINREPEETCIYKRLRLDYTYGLDRIYSKEDIALAKKSPSWDREYCLKFAGLMGNVFHYSQVDKCVILGEQYSLEKIPVNYEVSHILGLDPGFSSSRTAFTLVESLKEYDKVRVLYSEELEGHPSPDEIVKKVWSIYQEYGHNTWIMIDGSARGLITQLKIAFDENINYKKAEDVSLHSNRIIPVNFVTEHKLLLQNLYGLVANEYLCIPESMEKVIISLKSAVANEYSLDKTQSSYSDTLDSLRLACRPFHFT